MKCIRINYEDQCFMWWYSCHDNLIFFVYSRPTAFWLSRRGLSNHISHKMCIHHMILYYLQKSKTNICNNYKFWKTRKYSFFLLPLRQTNLLFSSLEQLSWAFFCIYILILVLFDRELCNTMSSQSFFWIPKMVYAYPYTTAKIVYILFLYSFNFSTIDFKYTTAKIVSSKSIFIQGYYRGS